MSDRWRRSLSVLAAAGVFIASLVVLRHELGSVRWLTISRELTTIPARQLLLAVLCTVLSYLTLISYDVLALRTVDRRLPLRQVGVAAFLSYAVSNNIGFAVLSGTSVRYRFYTRWGVTAEELARVVVSYSMTFWLGLFALGGTYLALTPPFVSTPWSVPIQAAAGWLLAVVPIAFLVMAVRRPRPRRIWGFTVSMPGPRLALLQLAASMADWSLTAAVAYVLLPAGTLPFHRFLGPFLAAVLLGMISHVPGGLGVFEGGLALLLGPFISSAVLLPRLVVYRICYYLLPFVVALVGLTVDELHQRREQAARLAGRLGWLTEQITPRLFGMLAVALAVFARARPAFSRRAAFFETTFSGAWIASVAAAIVASIWLGLFAFKHVNYTHDLWWQFALRGEASRFLRGSVGAAMVALLFAAARLIRPAPHWVEPPSDGDMADAAAIIDRQATTAPNLVYLGDKGLLFNPQRTAFLMYGVQGRTWVALGDPVGPDEEVPGLIRGFLERADDFNGTPVFYEVSARHLHRYADFGLACVKVGEEARVDLQSFTIEGPRGGPYRKVMRRLEKDGGTFDVVPAAEVPSIIGELRRVSDDWLRARAGTEKGFSLGFFDPAYLSRFPVAVVRASGRIVAFANLWPGAERVELSVDLMRFHHDAPKGTMEALFAHLLVWGRSEGYRWFVIGMAPLAGVHRSPVPSTWNLMGSLLYAHGTRVYNFQGLRAYKEKFDPVWQPRYLVYPGGLTLPRLLADIAALIAGGYRRLFRS